MRIDSSSQPHETASHAPSRAEHRAQIPLFFAESSNEKEVATDQLRHVVQHRGCIPGKAITSPIIQIRIGKADF
jgi:hypothetical protein